jgi:arylsulfatase
MHLRTHVREDRRSPPGLTARTEYADGMVEHDMHVGLLLKKLDDLGIANDTIVVYTTDNGPHMNTWPDGAMTPFRSEKNTNWEGAFRVPAMIRWPGRIQPGSVSNEMLSALDWMPTLLAAAGDPNIKDKLLRGHTAAGKTFKVHLDGYNQLAHLTGQDDRSARKEFFYFNDDGQLVAMRHENWKIVFSEQRAPGTLRVWAEPFTPLRLPKFFDLRADPYERADVTSNTYYDWMISQVYLLVGAQAEVAKFQATFDSFPPRQKAASFTVSEAMSKMESASGSH